MNRNVLVVAAHPDDESLGCGGTIARHIDNGDKVYVVFVADGESSRELSTNEDLERRKVAASEACGILGIETPIFLGFPDNRLDNVPLLEVIQKIEEVVNKINPSVIYTHHGHDLNIDHRITFQAVITACRPQPEFPVSEIYCFEVLSSTEWIVNSPETIFIPNCYVDITSTFSKKLDALKKYKHEMREFPHSRSYKNIESLASLRGATIGVEYAEAFNLVRYIIKEK